MNSKSPGFGGWILLLFFLFDGAASDALGAACSVICDCSSVPATANCSYRSFLTLSLPGDLPGDIQHLDLSHNDLTIVNISELVPSSLLVLDISHNQLTEITGGVLPSLKILNLSHNNISSIRSVSLESFPRLEELHLANNHIISLPSNSFVGTLPLQILNLKSNKLVNLEAGCLDPLVQLRELVLTKNRLSSFPMGLFTLMKSLRVLELNKNKFVEIQGLSFHGLDNLEVLKLRRNMIEFLMDGSFFGLHNIQELYLDRNRVMNINKGWLYGLTKLRILSMSHNRVDYITDDAWEFCEVLDHLDLSHNKLQILDRDSLRTLPRLQTLNLNDNLISQIDMDDSTFAEVPALESLSLDGNQISHTIEDVSGAFHGLKGLRALSLSRNQIRSVGKGAFIGLENLTNIDLRDNIISTMQENAFAPLRHLKTILINSASLLCDCYLKWFPRMVQSNGIEGGSAKCAHPENLKGTPIMDIPYENFTCDDFPKPYILKQPETQITLRSSNLTLLCRAASTSPAEMTFEWRLDSEIIETASCPSAGPCVEYEAHSFDGKGREITSKLRLANLTHDDAGSYQCVVSNRFGATYSDKANITVYVYPQFVLTPSSDVITVEGGATATLECGGVGVPRPDVSWTKDQGSEVPAAIERRMKFKRYPSRNDRRTEINSFVIDPVKAKDSGVYTCTASNPAGRISWNITLSVLETPKFVKPMDPLKSVPEGETAVIECMASGSPKPRLTWRKDGEDLQATERHFFTADSQLLIIVKAKPTDAGTYECTMHNQLGTETQSSVLSIAPPITTVGQPSDPTTGIIIIAVVCCLVGTLLIWIVFFIFLRARKQRRPEEQMDEGYPLQDTPNLTFDIHEHVATGLMTGHGDVSVTGSRDMTTRIDKTCLTMLQNEDEAEEKDSGTGDSKRSNDNMEDEEEVESLLESVLRTFNNARPPQQGAGESTASLSDFDGKCIPFADDGSVSDRTSERRDRSRDGSSDRRDVSSERRDASSSENKRAPCPSLDGSASPVVVNEAVPFRTFQPRVASHLDVSRYADTPRHADTSLLDVSKTGRKRTSTVELNGECYMQIEPSIGPMATVEPAVYRGGCGTLPRNGLDYQQELLEMSLERGIADRVDNPRHDRRRRSFVNSLPRRPRSRRNSGGKQRARLVDHSDVANKSKDMFT